MKQIIKETKLSNGVVVMTDYMPHAYSVTVGAWFPRGSRHEAKGEFGLSHFYEHLVFKGTENRTALEIARAIEDRGGNLEAYTTRQETGFYANVESGDLALAIDVIADMLMNPRFEKKEMEKERKVIIEEVHSYDDIPEELVGDVFNAIHFKGCGIAHSITGTVKEVKELTHKQMLAYRDQVINELPIYVCAAGKVNHDALVELCLQKFARKKSGGIAPANIYKSNQSVKVVQKQDITQSNLFWGMSFDKSRMDEKGRCALSIFNVAMGAGMASRLFQKIREDKGLAYSVYSTADIYRDCVDWGVALATEPKQLKLALELSVKETKKFLKQGFMKDELERTKANILGGMHLGADNPEKRAIRMAEQILHLGEFHTMEHSEKIIRDLTAEDVTGLTNDLFANAKYSAAVVEPKSKKKSEITTDFF
ncbi:MULTISPECIES: pitrilysin family protein [unclassified Fibrobacter]|uniref:M16 family metallopeptidase n=1 Tax=unclassified Fibrobacter TaxID=2634177 RepID=UPI00091D73D8|nr:MULTISPECIES: pitrilysin family protein [unclassified Fibrobacter]OWV04745.1 peptidase M16 [Fibrobacter sp. UWH3]OWV13878.1 peptidase M16 [Fibrobacter sp. UWH1]SHL16319.1 Predicted Zn-dependent peptidase [Fibrobacter sp. UWH6]